MTFVYAKCDHVSRRLLLRHLASFQNDDPWMLVGDFNAIVSSLERKGGSTPNTSIIAEFSSFIHSMGLQDCSFSGSPFTWCNKHLDNTIMWQRLDRVLLIPVGG